MNIFPISTINNALSNKLDTLIQTAELGYANQLYRVAKQIYIHRSSKPVLLLSGPSGSGKTTSALRIGALLHSWGCPATTLSMDNYYLPEDETPDARTVTGEVDYESPYRLDIPLLNEQLARLSRGEAVEIPTFNFAKQRRETGPTVQRDPDGLIILEGIHALNPEVTGDTASFASCLYVSVRTRLERENGALLHPSKIRLMRRLMRDQLFRGRQPQDTLAMFQSVSRGEDLYIMPHKHRATYEVDTLLSYEANVYTDLLLPALQTLSKTMPDYDKYADIEEFLTELSPIPSARVPGTSLVREFIGGSHFAY